ncbi:MAG: type II toxin-antitoxin system RelE/ParE family toxin [Pseudohongiella sp.]|jgi:toxin HigB-1|nr:type II toxin-antitoxin system RelE/ParE family toxin [Pseudohongiella sp.]MDP2092002.1 type II toxin-antitoxin system RelE/ParE family toxin [Pseudohongiella sp.]
MIKTFKHKGLKLYYETGNTRGIQSKHASRLRMQLAAMDSAMEVSDLDIPGYKLHPLKGDRKGIWAISVSGNWRLTFEFRDGHVYLLDYEDYH